MSGDNVAASDASPYKAWLVAAAVPALLGLSVALAGVVWWQQIRLEGYAAREAVATAEAERQLAESAAESERIRAGYTAGRERLRKAAKGENGGSCAVSVAAFNRVREAAGANRP